MIVKPEHIFVKKPIGMDGPLVWRLEYSSELVPPSPPETIVVSIIPGQTSLDRAVAVLDDSIIEETAQSHRLSLEEFRDLFKR